MSVIVAEQTRGPLVENVYRGDAAVVDATGKLLFRVGDSQKVTFWRSAAKPVQAIPIITSGAADAFGFTSEHLAIICSSHNGEEIHLQKVAEALQLAQLPADLLQCGAHFPFDRITTQALKAAEQEPDTLHNNCSGKHTGMLSLAKHLGLPMDRYMEPDSQVQHLILKNVSDVVEVPADQIALGVDGCGVPVFGLPLHNMAYAFARLADPDRMPRGKETAARRFRDAMIDHPYLVAGRRRICTDLMNLPGRRFVAKSGAEGVYCVGVLPEAVSASSVLQEAGATGGIGIAVKAEDGHNHVRHLVTVAILDQLGLLTAEDKEALKRYRSMPVKNVAGRVVGETRPTVQVIHS